MFLGSGFPYNKNHYEGQLKENSFRHTFLTMPPLALWSSAQSTGASNLFEIETPRLSRKKKTPASSKVKLIRSISIANIFRIGK